MSASTRWRTQLEDWGIPAVIRAARPHRDPWSLDVAAFVAHAAEVDDTGTAHRRGREALGGGGTVLDVGCGAGAATVGLGPTVRHATGVDERADMLDAFIAVMDDRAVPRATVEGRWPDVAERVGSADVVVSHHVVYNVPDVGAFLLALGTRARRRVVLEYPDRHPRAWANPYWEAVHDLRRPEGPTSDDLLAVAREVGLDPTVEDGGQPSNRITDRERRLDHLQSYLCLHDEDRDRLAAVDEQIAPAGDRRLMTMWWDTSDACRPRRPRRTTRRQGC